MNEFEIKKVFILITILCLSSFVFTQGNMLSLEAKDRARLRYVIVYNEVVEENKERRVEILTESASFNRANLSILFNQISTRFPEPTQLLVNVHTSLNTIETPEERDKQHYSDTDDAEMLFIWYKYRHASFSRWPSGRQAFSYTISLRPYKEKTVVLSIGQNLK